MTKKELLDTLIWIACNTHDPKTRKDLLKVIEDLKGGALK